MILKRNFKGNSNYYLLDGFDRIIEDIIIEIFGDVPLVGTTSKDESYFYDSLRRVYGLDISKKEFYNLFDCEYNISGNFAEITLDGINKVFINEEDYLSYMSFGTCGNVYINTVNIIDGSIRTFRIY